MRMRELVVGVAVVICVAGCKSSPDDAPKATPKEVVTTIDPAKATTLKLGDDLEIVAKLPRKLGEQNAYFDGFTPDGKVLGSVSLPEKPSGEMGSITSQSHPVIYDLESEEFTVLDDRERKEPTGVASVLGTKDFVVWMETHEANIGVSDIAIYSYDRHAKVVTELVRTGPSEKVVYGGDLAVRGDTAYYSMPAWNEEDRADSAVYSVPVDGSSPAKVLVKGGATVSLVDGSLRYTLGKGKWFSRDLATGETRPAPVSSKADDPGFCGAEFTESFETLCMGKPTNDETEGVIDPVLTVKESSGRTTVFAPFPTDSLNYPVPHGVVPIGPWVGVTMTGDGGADREFLVDLESRAVKAFPKGTSFGALTEDRTLVLLSTPGTEKTWPQVVVRIPRKD
jgi:hypothetical protein